MGRLGQCMAPGVALCNFYTQRTPRRHERGSRPLLSFAEPHSLDWTGLPTVPASWLAKVANRVYRFLFNQHLDHISNLSKPYAIVL